MTPEPPPLKQMLHLVDRAERGALLPAEAAQLRTQIRALYAHAHAYPQPKETTA
jgi:hypothetical protein